MVTSSQITRLDCGVKIGQFLRTIMPSHYVRENSARVVLAAFNAFRKVRRLDRQFPRKHSAAKQNPTLGVTFFLEDVECDEMHNYANHVASVIGKHIASSGISSTISSTSTPSTTNKSAWEDSKKKRLHMESTSVIPSTAPYATKIQSMHGINWGGKSLG
jgi:hypothetical protein